MGKLDLKELTSQESFFNYCFQSNPVDVAYWENWLKAHPEDTDQLKELKAGILLLSLPVSEKIIRHDFQRLTNSIANLNQKKGKVRKAKLWPRMAGIAVLAAIVLSGVYFFSYRENMRVDIQVRNDIKPGGNKAILKLEDGSSILLNAGKNGVVFETGKMSYDDGTSLGSTRLSSIQTLIMETPKGGQYEAVLPDGTHVWLNAASSISFPSKFTGANRVISLTGEAYLEVAKDKSHPFLIKTTRQKIEVLGTHLNVSAYADEPLTKTTLLEGSVRLSHFFEIAANGKILKPGEQAQLNYQGEITITQVNTHEAIAWKEGKFVFKDEPLENIMKKIARWYDVEVIYQGINPRDPFWGSVSRFENVSKVLEKLELTGGVHFRITGRKIYVTK